MKNSVTLSLLFVYSSLAVYAQDQPSLQNLKTPNSPGFQILDIAPSSIERPTNPKEFALSVFNLTNNGTALPKNFAFEISPYWFFKPSSENVYKYLNLRHTAGGIGEGDAAGGILRKLSISFSSSFNDSITGSLLANTNYIAFGARTNIFTINGKKHLDALTNSFTVMRTEINRVSFAAAGVRTPDEIEAALNTDDAYQQAIKSLTAPPLFQLDVAYAYSEAFVDNQYSEKRFNRSGLWLSATLSGGSLLKSKKDQLAIIALGRAIWDNALVDTAGNVFERKNAFDIGGKIDWTVGNLSLSFEHLNRIYSGAADLNSKRTVGIVQYKINDNLYVTGSYGETFGNSNNLITLFGINWNFGESSLSIPNP